MKRFLALLLAALLALSLAACSFLDDDASEAYTDDTEEIVDDSTVYTEDAEAPQDDYSTTPTATPAPTATPTPDWRSAYAQAVLTRSTLANGNGVEIMGAYLFYLNDDDIPELYLSYSPMAAGSELFTYDGNTVDIMPLSGGIPSYRQQGNVLLNRYIHTGSGWDEIYTIRNGRITLLTNGESELRLLGDDTLEYSWNGVVVSESEYNAKLNAIADVNGLWELPDHSFYDDTLFNAIGA